MKSVGSKLKVLGILSTAGAFLGSSTLVFANPLGRTSSLSRTSSIRSSVSSRGLSRAGSNISTSLKVSTGSQLDMLNARIKSLENARDIEQQRANHPFNKAVVASGILSSGMLVAGVVGGIAQQLKFKDLADEQAKTDQQVQEDLTNKRYYFQEVEVKEAEQYIIDYYKNNYGIDITK